MFESTLTPPSPLALAALPDPGGKRPLPPELKRDHHVTLKLRESEWQDLSVIAHSWGVNRTDTIYAIIAGFLTSCGTCHPVEGRGLSVLLAAKELLDTFGPHDCDSRAKSESEQGDQSEERPR